MDTKATFFRPRRRGFFALCAAALLLFAGAVAAKDQKDKKGKRDPEKQLAKAQALYEQGKLGKAGQAFQLAAQYSKGKCLECLLGSFRCAAAGGRFDEAFLFAGAAMDAAEKAEEEEKLAVSEEVENVFRTALEATGGSDPDVLWGLIAVLGRRERASEIVRLAGTYLDTAEEKSLLCAADGRSALTEPEHLPVAAEVNEELRALGWDGPLLVSHRIRRPRLRNKSYNEGTGARMAGVVDRRGFLEDVRLVRPPPDKITGEVRDSVRRALFDPATYRGQRLAVCYPFSVRLPGQTTVADRAAAAAAPGSGTTTSALYNMVRDVTSADKIIELIENAGVSRLTPAQRAAVCAAQFDHDDLNRRFRGLDWPGPFFFDTDDVEDPVPLEAEQPEYTESAREAEVEGEVVLSTVVDETGRVVHIEVVATLPEGLTGQAVAAVRKWTFEPAVFAGRKISVCREVTLEFELD